MMRFAFLSAFATLLAAQSFRTQQIDQDTGVVYAVEIADINADGKPDIVAVLPTRIVWYENPSWRRHVAVDGVTEKDNVAIAIHDVDSDGKLDFAIAAAWRPSDTQTGGTLQWARNPGAGDAPWPVMPLGSEPTLHRIRFGDLDGDRKPELVGVPLHGRGTKGPQWEGSGLRVLVYRIPKDPAKDPWPMEVADGTLHEAHNFLVTDGQILIGAAEGLYAIRRGKDGVWNKTKWADGQPGEVKLGRAGKRRVVATVEPYHGNNITVFEQPKNKGALWTKQVVDTQVLEGHAVGFGDFDADGNDELVGGWRGTNAGVALYKRTAEGAWKKQEMVDDGGMACEDLVVADLDGDKRPEIIAGGRRTRNVRIYWNQFKR